MCYPLLILRGFLSLTGLPKVNAGPHRPSVACDAQRAFVSEQVGSQSISKMRFPTFSNSFQVKESFNP